MRIVSNSQTAKVKKNTDRAEMPLLMNSSRSLSR